MFLGILQDLFVSYECVFFLIGIQKFPFGRLLGTFFCFLIVFYALMDAYLYRAIQLRLHHSFFSYLRDIPSLWSSAKEIKLLKTLPLFFLLGGGSAGFFLMLPREPLPFPTPIWTYAGIAIVVLAFLGNRWIPKAQKYQVDNILFWEQVQIGKAFSKKKRGALPPLKFTHGFEGEKQFHLEYRKKEKPHVVFLFLESFRAKDVGILGGDKQATPTFDALAKEGILFSRFYANTMPTLNSVLTSLYGIPFPLGNFLESRDFSQGIPEILHAYGYQNAYVHGGNLDFDRQGQIFKQQGFDDLFGKKELLQKFPNASFTSWGVHDSYLMRYAAEFLKNQEDRGQPSFLSIVTLSNHHPWQLPKDYRAPEFPLDKRDLYYRFLQTMHYTDHSLSIFIDLLKEKTLSEKTLLFILGDHGYPLGEHRDNFTIQKYLYEENVHIPLLIYAEGRIVAPKIIDQLASQVDLLPTLMDLLHLQGAHRSIGNSLVRRTEDPFVFLHSPYAEEYVGCRQENDKYMLTITSQEEELYDLKSDPEERDDLFLKNSQLAAKLKTLADEVYKLFVPKKNENSLSASAYYEVHAPSSLKDEELCSIVLKDSRVLKTLHLNHACISDRSLKKIAPFCKDLEFLSLTNCALITDHSLEILSMYCRKLKHLDLTHCLLLSDRGISQILESSPQIESLHLQGVQDITDASLKMLLRSAGKLKKIDLIDCPHFTDQSIEILARSCPNLEIWLCTCENISDRALEKMGKKCKKLKHLWIQKAAALTDLGVSPLVQNGLTHLFLEGCPQVRGFFSKKIKTFSLTHLCIHDCPKLEDIFFEGLDVPYLETLSLKNLPGISDTGIKRVKSIPIRHVSIDSCPNISLEAIEELRQHGFRVIHDKTN